MATTCGHCKLTNTDAAHVRACAKTYWEGRRLTESVRSAAKDAAERSLTVHLGTPVSQRLTCESGPAGIGCNITGIPGVAGTGWNGQRFTHLFTCPRCHGKGYETAEDRRRNLAHDDFYMARMIRADF